MTMRPASAHPDPGPVVDQLVARAIAGAGETTRQLLETASGGDPRLLRALVLTGFGLGELAPVGVNRLADLISEAAAGLPDAQLAALCAVTELSLRPHAAASAEQRRRAAAQHQPDLPALTQRELEVLALLAIGLTAQAIGHRLQVSPRTVAKHQERMYRKLGTSDRLTTVLQAQRLGLLEPVVAER